MAGEIRTEHNMGELDFYRYDAMLKCADETALLVKLPPIDPRNILAYYKILDQLYLNLRTIMNNTMKIKIDAISEKIQKEMFNGGIKMNQTVTKISKELITNLREMHKLILMAKQRVGMGHPTFREESEETKLKRIFNIS